MLIISKPAGENIPEEITESARVTPLIIIPGERLEKLGIQFDSSLYVEDGGE